MPKRYQFLLFDFVNTLFMPDPSAVPTIEIDGKQVVSTAARLRETLPEHFGHLDVRAIHQAHRETWTWVEAQRQVEHQEIDASVRFRRLLDQLEMDGSDEALVQRTVAAHMAVVTGAFKLPADHRALLERLRGRYRMSILSNFDHGPSLHALIDRHGIREWFEAVVISADIGWRKPSRKAFDAALAGINLPLDAVLHVGDTWIADVEGARAASLDVVWINATREPTPQESRATYVVERLTDLESLLD